MVNSRADSGDVFCSCVQNGVGEVGLGFGEGGDEPWKGAEEVGDNGDFTITGGFAAADADGGDGDGLGDGLSGGGGDGFEDDGEDSGIDEGVGAVEKRLGLFGGFAFFVVSTLFEDPLREHAEVATDRNSSLGDGVDFFRLADTAFELHSIGSGGDEGVCGGEGLCGSVVGVDGEIGDDESGGFGSDNGFEVVKDVRERHVGGVRESKDDHSERVADEENIDTGLIEQARRGIIVAGEGGDGAGSFFSGDQGDFLFGSHESLEFWE